MLGAPWGITLDSSSNIWVTNESSSSITAYAANATGNAVPERAIFGSLTQLNGPEGIAVDASGYAYVANWEESSLVVFAPGANGNEAPARQDSSGLYGPNGVAVDVRGRTYLSNGCQDDPAFVAVYAEGANGAGPLRIIEGKKTKLDDCATSIVVR
ncbi:MAG: SMP-30/gluconolactonase/LRE family protein [Candidatus Cybelea sp.]